MAHGGPSPIDGMHANASVDDTVADVTTDAGRPSGGYRSLGTVVEGRGDVTIDRYWSVNAYVGGIAGGAVVRALFAGDRLPFFYVENVLGF